MKIFFSFLTIIFCQLSLAQNIKDTTIDYLNDDYKRCASDTASFVSKIYKIDNGRWHQLIFLKNNLDTFKAMHSNSSQFDGAEDTTIVYGKKINEYFSKGSDNLTKREFFSKKGQKLGSSLWDKSNKMIEQKGWDENGNEIPKYIYFKEATYPGDARGWMNYLTRALHADVPQKNNAPIGKYTVVTHFLINKNGSIERVEAENDPGYGTAEEAIRVVTKSGKWHPAIQNNESVTYFQRQQLTFVVN